MRRSALKALALLIAAGAVAAYRLPEPAPASHLVVFNRLGPNHENIGQSRDAVLAHQRLYRSLAEEGKIIAGGRFTGEPVLGLSIFASDVDRAQMKSVLENDAAVKAGLVSVEFREWQLQMGGL